MTIRHFCTYFDHNYLPRGMVMLESLHEHCPRVHVHVLCLSDACYAALHALAYPYVSLLRLSTLEDADRDLTALKNSRNLIEYYFTITPCLPWFLLAKQGLEEVTYLDADMLFFSSPEPLFEEASGASVIITPHRFSPGLEKLEEYGKYNVSWLTFRNTGSGRACLSWYRAACLEWCKDELDGDRFADQKYLEAFPKLFPGVHCMENYGGGVAPWNIAGTDFLDRGGIFTVNNSPLIFYHAQGFKHIAGPFYTSGLLLYGAGINSPTVRRMLSVYASAYATAVSKAKKIMPISTFEGIRFTKESDFTLLRNAKRIAIEACNKTLVWHL